MKERKRKNEESGKDAAYLSLLVKVCVLGIKVSASGNVTPAREGSCASSPLPAPFRHSEAHTRKPCQAATAAALHARVCRGLPGGNSLGGDRALVSLARLRHQRRKHSRESPRALEIFLEPKAFETEAPTPTFRTVK